MSATVPQQVERILDEAEGSRVSVLVQAKEDDPVIAAVASAAALAVSERQLARRARELLPDLDAVRSGQRRGRANATPSLSRAVAALEGADPPKRATAAAVKRALRPVLSSPPVRAAQRRSEEGKAEPATPLRAARSVAVTLTRDEVASLREHSDDLAGVFLNRHVPPPRVAPVRSLPPAVAEHEASAYGVDVVGALAVWGAFGARGKGSTIAVLDTGVDATHPDLTGKVAHWAEFDGLGAEVAGSTAHDTDQHGTHVCGIVAGGNASGRWIGVAPDAKLAVAMVLDGQTGGTDAQILAGIDWALDRGAHVVSMSLGGWVLGPETPSTYTRAFLDAMLVGVPVVCAIGNDGAETGGSPGNDIFALAVGATGVDDVVAGFSGGRTQVIASSSLIRPEFLPLVYSKPDLVAPGVAVTSCVPGGAWDAFSGTSMATPHVAGAIALLLSATRNLEGVEVGQRVGTVQDLLIGSVTERGELGQDHRYGFGRLDALRAVGLAVTTASPS